MQALIAIVMAHSNKDSDQRKYAHSVVVCPSTVVGHWMNEAKRIDPEQKFLTPLNYTGNTRKSIWSEKFEKSNLIITR